MAQLAGGEAVALAPGSGQLYFTHDGGIVTLRRNADGVLSFQSCLNDTGTGGCANSSNMSGLNYLAVSPDGETWS